LNDTSLAARMCALEKRITAIEATLTSSPVSSLRQIRSSRPAPGWLAEQVAIAICRVDDSLTWNEEVINWKPEACAAITACASWLEAQGVGAGVAAARWLREEAARACAVSC
jgi:hypothetical protein